ncbi:MAG: hypothetical protein H6765_03065 [Candidatus Peribacteria bacterium]|nr:MAG: hypothetical protein H6765_03065 [Candidatus Peribacteria bacterium]
MIRGDIILQENLAEYVGISLDDLDDGSVVYSSDDSNAQLIDVLNFPSDYLENTLLYD